MTPIHHDSASTVPAAPVLGSGTSGHVRRVGSCVGASALLIAGTVLGAQSAHAAPATPAALTMTSACQSWTENSTSSVIVTGAVGDTFTAVQGNNCGSAYGIYSATGKVTADSAIVGYPAPTTFTIVGPGRFTIAGFGSLAVTIVIGASSGGVSSGAALTPDDVFQSIALTGSSSCAFVTRPALDWSGVASGNWTQSWAMWPNGGTGGPVCNRVLWYDSNTSRWSSALR